MSAKHIMRSKEEWKELIIQCKSSGLSDYQWCRQNNVSLTSYYRNLKKLRNEINFSDVTPNNTSMPEIHEVVPLEIQEETLQRELNNSDVLLPAARISIGTIEIELFNHTEPSVLKQLLHLAVQIC